MNLLSLQRTFNWLDHVITGDEKWVLYINHTSKRQWLEPEQPPKPTPKVDLHPKKVLFRFGGTCAALCTRNFFRRTPQLRQQPTVLNSTSLKRNSQTNARSTTKFTSSMTTPVRTLQNRRGKNYWSLAGRCCPIRPTRPTYRHRITICSDH
jgi:hypothetical protein